MVLEIPEKEIFISYAWGGDSEDMVDAIAQAFLERGYVVTRDKSHLTYRDSIKKFMDRLGRGKFIIIVVSDKYMKSEYCMYEAYRMFQSPEFNKRVYPIVLEDANIFGFDGQASYLLYWTQKLKKVRAQHREVSEENPTVAIPLTMRLRDIESTTRFINDFMAQVADMNVLTPEHHAETSYGFLIQAIEGGEPEASLELDPQTKVKPEPQTRTLEGDMVIDESISQPEENETKREEGEKTIIQAGLMISLSAAPNPAPVNTEVTWTLTIWNNGVLPVTELLALWGSSRLAEFELDIGQEQMETFSTYYSEPGQHTETVQLYGSGPPQQVQGSLQVIVPAHISLRLEPESPEIEPNKKLTWQVTITNDGGEDLSQVLVFRDNDLLQPAFDLEIGKDQQLHFETRYRNRGDRAEEISVVGSTGSGAQVRSSERAVVKVADLVQILITDPIEMDFLRIPAGEFLMGSDPKIDNRTQEDEQPQHRVALSEYLISKSLVTNSVYSAFAEAKNYKLPKHWKDGKIPEGKENHPVVNVSWHDAVAFCEWLSESTGYTIRLPTEAEWEKAARGTEGQTYPWGDDIPSMDLANFASNIGSTTEVGKYSPQGDSPYGCVDMAGNVWEWVADWYSEKYYRIYRYGVKNPAGPSTGEKRVLRGGAWNGNEINLRSAKRDGDYPGEIFYDCGFRCVLIDKLVNK